MNSVRSIFTTFNNKIEEPVRLHLRNVYACLTLSSIMACIGGYVHLFTNMGSVRFFPALAGVGLLFALKMTPDSDKNRKMRLGYLLGFSFCSGLSMGVLLDFAIAIDPSIIVTALMATMVIFASFTLSSLFAQRGYFLFLAGPLLTMLSSLLLLSLANILFGSYLLYQVNLYLGLVTMCGFVLFDTALIVEKRRMGDKDYVGHSIDLFVDLIGIFKRLVIILSQKEENNRRKRN